MNRIKTWVKQRSTAVASTSGRLVRGIMTWLEKWSTILVFITAAAATWGLVCLGYAEIMSGGQAQPKNQTMAQPVNEIIRNYGLLIAAFWAAALAVWRGRIADEQAETANRQAETSERGLRNDRYQKSADMLGGHALAVRLGGIYALRRLALDHPKDYLDQIIKLLCAFARHPTKDTTIVIDNGDGGRPIPRRDVLEAVQAIVGLDQIKEDHGKPDLRGVKLSGAALTRVVVLTGATLSDADLSGADLIGADLTKARLTNANLTEAKLYRATLTDAPLTGATLTRAIFTGADLTRADLTRATLTGADLRGATLTDANLTGAKLPGAGLPGANLTGAKLTYATLTEADLTEADLTDAILFDATLTGATLTRADLTCADLTDAFLTRAIFTNADLTGADLSEAKELTQEQLDEAVQSESGPPPKLPDGLTWDEPAAIERWRELMKKRQDAQG